MRQSSNFLHGDVLIPIDIENIILFYVMNEDISINIFSEPIYRHCKFDRPVIRRTTCTSYFDRLCEMFYDVTINLIDHYWTYYVYIIL